MSREEIASEKFIKVYNKNEVIFSENSSGNEMYIVCSGMVKLYAERQRGRRTVLSVLKPGEHFGEMALIDRSARSATAVAIKDNTKLVILDKPKFLYLVQQQPDFAFAVMETLCKRLRNTDAQIATVKHQRARKLPPGRGGEDGR